MTPSIGDKIIAAIKFSDLAVIEFGFHPTLLWKPKVSERLEAVVEAHIEERVKAAMKQKESDDLYTERGITEYPED